jgi:hypothetical protein
MDLDRQMFYKQPQQLNYKSITIKTQQPIV